LTPISTSGVVVRVWPGAVTSLTETDERSRRSGTPLLSDAALSAASEWTISLTVRGFVARLRICPPPSGANGCPR
jgi:hypothetical protein